MTIKALIDSLNNLTIGEFDTLTQRVEELRREAGALGLEQVESILADALGRLAVADAKGFRRKVQHAVSRLGHARESRHAGVGVSGQPRDERRK